MNKIYVLRGSNITMRYIIAIIACIVLGIIIGLAVRRERQETQCPYCSCRECCDIGHGITAAISDEKQKPFVCMR